MSVVELVHLLFTENPNYFYLTTFVFSLLIGSFLNVVIYRLPIMMQNEWQQECRALLAENKRNDEHEADTDIANTQFDLIKPDSHCPHCKTKLKAWHNIPLFSYLFLKGKCASCHTHIPMRYPLVELFTAVLSAAVAYTNGYNIESLFMILITWFFICLVLIDFDNMLLPDQLTLPLLWIILFVSQWQIFLSPVATINGAVAGYLSLWTVYWIFKLFTGKEGMGYGDFKLLAVVGAIVGVWKLPMVILISALLGLIFIGGRILLRLHESDKPAPFGPYIAISGWLTMLWGDPMFHWYISVVTT